MREEDSNWFAKWEEELPTPEELMPLSQTLITPDLALAFDIHGPPQPNSSTDYDSDLMGPAESESARTLKRPRLVWTPQLHKRFVDAVAHLGIKNAVPKTIMQLMSVDGLTRENVASHLQKYRLYLKRMQGISNGGGGGGGSSGVVDTAMDRLFASAPVPAHFLRGGGSEHYMAYPNVAVQVHHQPQMVVPFLGRQGQQQQQGQRPAVQGNGNANGRRVLTLFPNGGD